MSSPKQWFFRGAQLAALLSSLATPGCLVETDDSMARRDVALDDAMALDDAAALDEQAVDPGLDYDLTGEPALELMAEGQRLETDAYDDPQRDHDLGGPSMDADFMGNEDGDDGEPTPQPWQAAASEERGEEGGPDPVPWDVANLGPDPVPWRNDDDLKASASGQTEGRRRYDPH